MPKRREARSWTPHVCCSGKRAIFRRESKASPSSPATVYAVTGANRVCWAAYRDLDQSLDRSTTICRIEQMDDSLATLRSVAATCRNFGTSSRTSRASAPHDKSIAAATSTYRQAFLPAPDETTRRREATFSPPPAVLSVILMIIWDLPALGEAVSRQTVDHRRADFMTQ